MTFSTVPVPVVSLRPAFGLVTVRGEQAYRRRTGRSLRVVVLVDGQETDVTERCLWADDRRGRAVLYLLDSRGRRYVGVDGRPARELYRGPVRIVESDT